MGGVRWAQCGVVHLAIPVLAAGQVLLHESCNSLKEMLVILFPLSCHGYRVYLRVHGTHTVRYHTMREGAAQLTTASYCS